MNNYPKIYNLGNKNIEELFDGEVIIEEKLDGSQLSIEKDSSGNLIVKSKECILNLETAQKPFNLAVETGREILHLLIPNYIYRFEFISKPRHNALTYGSVPKKYLVGFDIEREDGTFLEYEVKKAVFDILGIETTPLLYQGKVDKLEIIENMVKGTISFLGAANIEGVVIKNYSKVVDGKPIMVGKFVSDEFKEVKTKKKTINKTNDIIDGISEQLRTEARWNKAIQHLRDRGELTTSMRDIPLLIKEVCSDTHAECSDMVKELVFKWAWKQISQQITKGLPDHYKNYLAESAFQEGV